MTDSTWLDGQPSFLRGSYLTPVENKSEYAYTRAQQATCRHHPALNTASMCVYVWRVGGWLNGWGWGGHGNAGHH